MTTPTPPPTPPPFTSSTVLTEEQIRMAFQHIVGYAARAADVAVVQMMGGTLGTLAEYVWDHWLGEPDTPTVEKVEAEMVRLLVDLQENV